VDLYVIRHAEAVELGTQGVACDEERWLSEAGWRQTEVVARGLLCAGVAFDTIVTSPLVRARQTAEGLLQHWRSTPALEQSADLAPGGKKKELARFLRRLAAKRVAIVGHQPDLGAWIAWLIGSSKAQIELAKAGVAFVEIDGRPRKGRGTLRWLLTPDWLAAPNQT
jgi:phosphohistidine phosphatase